MGCWIVFDFEVYCWLNKVNDYCFFDQDMIGGVFGFILFLWEEELILCLFYNIFNEDNEDKEFGFIGINNCNNFFLLVICDFFGIYLILFVGYQLVYNMFDWNWDFFDGYFVFFVQQFVGVGGDSYYIKIEVEVCVYKEIFVDYGLVGSVVVCGGNIFGIGECLCVFE